MPRKPKAPKFTEGGSPIVSEYVQMDAVGQRIRYIDTRKLAAYVSDEAGYSHRVPIDSKGKVPMFAIVQHYLDTQSSEQRGKKRNIAIDSSKRAKTIHQIPDGGFTPEQIVATGWWSDPSSSDIEGIDDSAASFLDSWPEAGKKARSKTGRIALIGTPTEKERIRKVLTDNFTGQELEAAVKDSGMVISVGPTGRRDVAGFYLRRQLGSETPAIVLKEMDEDTITHEFVHHLRKVDPSRNGLAKAPFKVNEKGHVVLPPKTSYETYSNLEEATTVAETSARTREISTPSGYYWGLNGAERTKGEAYEHDRTVMVRGKTKNGPVRGKRATDRVNERFMETDISKLKYKGKGMRADRLAMELTAPPCEESWSRVGTGHWKLDSKGGSYDLYKPKVLDKNLDHWVLIVNSDYLNYMSFPNRVDAERYVGMLIDGGSL